MPVDDALRRQLEAVVEQNEVFAPAGEGVSKPEVSAALLRELICAPRAEEPGAKRLWLRGARVLGDLDLEAQSIPVRLRFEDCEFGGAVNLDQAKATDIRMLRCVFEDSLRCDQGQIELNLALEDSVVEGWMHLGGARLGGELSLAGTRFEGVHPTAGFALGGENLQVGENAICERISTAAEVRLLGARVGGRLSMSGAKLRAGGPEEGGSQESALSADRIKVAGNVSFRGGFSAKGAVRLLGAKIGGQVSFEGATLEGAEKGNGSLGPALSADRLEVANSMFCRHGFSAKGEVRLHGARIGGQLSFDGASFEAANPARGARDPALSADSFSVGGNLLCRKGFSAKGEVRLLGARIAGHLWMDGASLSGSVDRAGRRGPALNADRIDVGRNMFCRHGFTARGRIRMLSARVGGQLSLREARLQGSAGSCLNLTAAEVDELILALKEVSGTVDLRSARIRSLWDATDDEFMGEMPETLRLEGLRYVSLRTPLDAERRLEWIASSQREHHYPGVYAELASAFRRIGHSGEARKVAIASERRARQDAPRWSPRRAWHDLMWVTIGYGYRDWLAAIWLLALIALGAAAFAADNGGFTAAVAHPPPFSAILYSIDVTIPVLDLGQTRAWTATGWLAWVGLSLTIAGYALAAAVIAAAAGVFSRDQG